ncbi:hypothetical protein AHMF7605_08495 [Adhaeribacter arboris]|uniref:Uncharacterized protein n=1 Tax=Adhaeribacter arboris TaxID=2072846 RepID=A0A2T2YDH5_9BACT|nr:hypothetical protein [Adhaeribacter arboris]PSR53562.1 hypothetical protein AHMF7605_08495 [Adhaeribacter arboris]
MRKVVLSLIIAAFFSTFTQAQNIPSSAEKRITLLTRVMATELQLNEAEYIKLRALNRERILKSDEIAAMYSDNPAILASKLKEVETDFDKKFTALLNPVQLAAYKTYQETTDSKLTALQEDKTETKKPNSSAASKK